MDPLDRWQNLDARIVALYQQGWYAEAVNLAEEALKLAEENFGREHVNVAESLNKLALIFYAQAREVEAAMAEQRLGDCDSEKRRREFLPSARSLHRLVLVQLAKQKYAHAQGLLNRALNIKKSALGDRHPEVLQIMGNIADVSHAEGKVFEPPLPVHGEDLRGDGAPPRNAGAEKRQPRRSTHPSRSREHARCSGYFVAELAKAGSTETVSGVTENIGQSGAFIKIREWRSFRLNEEISVAIFLPSVFSDESATIRMEGRGFIARIDEEQEGVAVEFSTCFRQFKRREELEVPGKVRYKKLAHYMPAVEAASLDEFSQKFPRGFLIERFETIFDKDVIFQFSTRQFSSEDLTICFINGQNDTHILEARVIEISKRKKKSEEYIVTIGRSSSNDIVLYNKIVSKSHAFLYFPPDDKTTYIADVGSRNCTFVNDQKISPYEIYPLTENDEISFGPQTKVVYLSAAGLYQLLANVKGMQAARPDLKAISGESATP
ncbi:MAG TPA: FHA domain-containing protein [Syntrophobacteria bacterium]|nr:FHA domain-containing protein [Syntrophobacteria bacterium]